MKKIIIYSLFFTFIGLTVSAQENDVVNSRTLTLGKMVFKVYNNPKQEKTDQFEIQSIGQTTFSSSNTADGTANSYKHSLQIVVTLNPLNKSGNNNFQLIFYSPTDEIQQAATYTDGTLNIYFPVAVYDDIKTKLEQSFAARKKVTVKVTQKPNGYREGTLVL